VGVKNNKKVWVQKAHVVFEQFDLAFKWEKNELINWKKWNSLTLSATYYPFSAKNLCVMRTKQTSETFKNGSRKESRKVVTSYQRWCPASTSKKLVKRSEQCLF